MSIMPVITTRTDQQDRANYPFDLTIKMRFSSLPLMARWLKWFGNSLGAVFKNRHYKIVNVVGSLDEQTGEVIYKS